MNYIKILKLDLENPNASSNNLKFAEYLLNFMKFKLLKITAVEYKKFWPFFYEMY